MRTTLVLNVKSRPVICSFTRISNDIEKKAERKEEKFADCTQTTSLLEDCEDVAR